MTEVIPDLSIPTLREIFKGRVIGPGDPDYDEARAVFPGGFDRRPAVIVRVADAAEVSRAVGLARDSGLPLSVRSGGHSGAAHGVCDDGIVIDLRDLTSLEIDAETRTAWAGTGLTAAEYTRAAGEHHLATGFGDTGSVGVGGITLSGGIGFLVRKFGLTIDSVLAAEVVTADGSVLQVDRTSHADLFWAIRGGGGNFGVVTRFKFRLHPVSEFVGGMLMLPATAELVTTIVGLAEAAPDELSMIVNIMPAPPMPFVPAEHHGQLVAMVLAGFAGSPAEGDRVLAPFRALATPIVDMIQPMAYAEMFPPEDDSYHPTAVGNTMFVDTVDEQFGATVVKFLQESDASLRVAQLRALGGAMARVPAEATAFAHRASRIMVNVAAFYVGPDDKPQRQEWADAFAEALRQKDTGAYVGFLIDTTEEEVRRAYPGATWDRLAGVKRRYDPANLFRHNQNIPPSQD